MYTGWRIQEGFDPTSPYFGHLWTFRELNLLREAGAHVVALTVDRWIAAPAAAAALATPSVQKTAPGWENTMAVKDGQASKIATKNSLM